MTFTFTPTSEDADVLQIARVRNHINDTTPGVEGTNYFLSDERIELFLADEADNATDAKNIAKLAAAAALDTLATNEAYVQKVQRTLSEESDGAKGADAIRKHAAALRAQVTAAEALVTSGGSSINKVMTRADGYSAYAESDEYERRCRC